MTVYDLPLLNAILNASAGVLLMAGWYAIKIRKSTPSHRWFMVAALVASAVFLTSYLTYHYMIPGVTRYASPGFDRTFYLLVLGTHTVLAAVVALLVPVAVWFAVRGRFDRHVRLTRWLWPVWMYVSVTGVLIYVMLYVFPGRGVREAVAAAMTGLN